MKRIIALVAALVLIFCSGLTAYASEGSQRVYDMAGLLSESDRSVLENEIDSAAKATGMDIVVVTTNDKSGATMREFADDFYDNGGFGTGDDHSGVLFLIDMEDRRVYMSTTGSAINYYDDARIYDMTDGDDTLFGYLGDGDYKSAIERCLGQLVYYYNLGIDPDQHTVVEQAPKQKRLTLFEIIIAVLVPGIIGLLVVKNIKNDYEMKSQKKQAADYRLAYRTAAVFAFAAAGDDLVNRNVTRRFRPVVVQTPGKGSGGHGSSTIHMGGSGTFHGGGGGGRSF